MEDKGYYISDNEIHFYEKGVYKTEDVLKDNELGFEDIKRDLHNLGYQEIDGIPMEGSHADENGNWQTWTPIDYRCLLNIAMHFYKLGKEL